jgi:MFS family permease
MRVYLYNFWLLAAGRVVSLIGSGIQSLALSLYILDVTGSGTMMGTFLVVTMVPKVIFAPLAGIVGDRFNRKRIMVLMDFGRGGAIFLLAFIAFSGNLALYVIYILQVFISIMDIFFDPATAAMLPELVPEEKLTRSNSILSALNAFSYIVGPAFGGILYPLGIQIVFLINGISFVVSGISEMFIKYNQSTEKKRMTLKQFFDDFKFGIIYFKNNRFILNMMMFFMLINFLISPISLVVLPFFAREVVGFSSFQYGLMEASWVLGTLIGNILIAVFLSNKKISSLFKNGFIIQMVFLAAFNIAIFPGITKALGGATWLYLGVIAIIFIFMGIFNAQINTPINIFFQRATPSEVRSRVFSVLGVISQLIVPLGTAIYGFLVDRIPAHILTLISLIVTIFFTVIFFAKGEYKNMDINKSDQKATAVNNEDT